MTRSNGLIQAYCTTLRDQSLAECVSLFVVRPDESAGLLVHSGTDPLPELASLDSAARCLHPPAGFPGAAAANVSTPEPMPSADGNGWIFAIPSAPRGETESGAGKRNADRQPAAGGPRFCWVGLRFGNDSDLRDRRWLAGQTWLPLLRLAGVLAWHTSEVSSLLDDPLTGLAGRAEFQGTLDPAIADARAHGRPVSLLLINPDDFATVNERYGHEKGDAVLREVGERLQVAHRSSDCTAKYGGAIFASLLVDTDREAARLVAEKVSARLSERAYLGETLRMDFSFGVAVLEGEDASVPGSLELIRRADKALNAARRLGGGQVVFWEPELEARETGNVDRMTGIYTGNMAKDYRNMTLLSDCISAVAESGDASELVSKVVHRLFHTLRATKILFFSIADDRLAVSHGHSKAAGNGSGDAPASSLSLSPERLRIVEQARREPRSLHVCFDDDRTPGRRALCFAVPLVLEGHCSGCLYLEGDEPSFALEDATDLAFLRAFAAQVAVALDRARLNEERRKRQELEKTQLREELSHLRAAIQQTRLVHISTEMDHVLETVRRAAPTRATVLITGESGTGKELIARTVHELSPFRSKPFIVVDCGAIPTTLIESELFGHERGAYTGAEQKRIGRLLEAEGGTIVLDEIGELPLEVQSKLLRFVQERQLMPVGGSRVRRVDTRLVAVTNRELAEEVSRGRFREDLYYRLKVISIVVPPLRERPDDILYLADHFLEGFSKQYQRRGLRFSPEARRLMFQHRWSGNVRELQNRILQAAILCESGAIGAQELELETGSGMEEPRAGRTPREAVEPERQRRHEPRLAEDATPNPTTSSDHPAPSKEASAECWQALGEALREHVELGSNEGGGEPLPIGSWLQEDLVLTAFRLTRGVSGRARVLLGVPETTFRRRHEKASAKERSGLLVRPTSWERVRAAIEALVSLADGRDDLTRRARNVLLEDVCENVEDETTAAALMDVTLRTYRRWRSALLGERAPGSGDGPASGASPLFRRPPLFP